MKLDIASRFNQDLNEILNEKRREMNRELLENYKEALRIAGGD